MGSGLGTDTGGKGEVAYGHRLDRFRMGPGTRGRGPGHRFRDVYLGQERGTSPEVFHEHERP